MELGELEVLGKKAQTLELDVTSMCDFSPVFPVCKMKTAMSTFKVSVIFLPL
jgi:hypothetical protein